MSVENRIFWLLVGILALYLVFSAAGRDAVNRFIHGIFGYGSGGSSAPAPAPAPKPKLEDFRDDPRDVNPNAPALS